MKAETVGGGAARMQSREWHPVPLGDARLHWLGRIDPARPVLAWSGSSLALRMRGTAVRVRLRPLGDGSMDPSGTNYYNLWVDGIDSGVVPISAAEPELRVQGLAEGEHTVRIEKATEALCGRDAVQQVELKGELLDPTPEAARRIVYFGNSITAGYGIEDAVATNSFQAGTENASVTYAAVAARLVGAQRLQICISGRGLVRNYDGTKDMLLPQFLDWTSPQERTPWRGAEDADVVVVEIGTNDFALGDPGELPFVLAYQELVGRLLARYPKAKVVLLDSPMLTDAWPVDPRTGKAVPSASLLQGYLAQVKGGLPGPQRQRVSVLQLAPQGEDAFGYGADYHPNRAQARCNGEELAAHLKAVMGW